MPSGILKKPSFIIVGAGAFGASTALHLIRRGYTDVLLLDSHSYPSPDQASNDTSRAVRTDYTAPFYAKLALKAIEGWRNDPVFAPHYHHTGRVGAARPDGKYHTKACKETLETIGVSFEQLSFGSDVSKLSEKFPGLNGPVPAWDLYYTPHEGWAHPRNAIGAALAEFQQRGGKFIGHDEKGRVVANILAGSKLAAVRTADGVDHEADKFIFALGAYASSRLLPGLDTQIYPTGFAIAHWRLTPLECDMWKDHPVVDLHHHGYFFPPDENGVMKMGTGIMGFGHGSQQRKDQHGNVKSGVATARKNSLLVGTRDEAAIPREAEEGIRWILSQMAPAFSNKPFFDMKVCWDGMTPDGGWIIDTHPEMENLVVAIGGSGHGFKFLPIVGQWISENACDQAMIVSETR
ncbi:FAD dependent oxidoreductase [Thozetella sp. PMI_491]|nr:FAD dependent oxidoreductase [Thozetella sp. PMI_491]